MTELRFSFRRKLEEGRKLLAEGEFTFGEGVWIHALMGPSGAGKTSLVRWIAGLENRAEGVLLLGQATWFDSSQKLALSPSIRRAGLVAQHPALFPHLTVRENVAYGLRRWARAERDARVGELLSLVGLGAAKEGARPASLSGGERRRVALAQALGPRPRLLLLDEPFTGLDRPTKEALWPEVRAWIEAARLPTILVTHEEAEARAFTRAIHRYDGDQLSIRRG